MSRVGGSFAYKAHPSPRLVESTASFAGPGGAFTNIAGTVTTGAFHRPSTGPRRRVQ